jgi:hypothetical protein
LAVWIKQKDAAQLHLVGVSLFLIALHEQCNPGFETGTRKILQGNRKRGVDGELSTNVAGFCAINAVALMVLHNLYDSSSQVTSAGGM